MPDHGIKEEIRLRKINQRWPFLFFSPSIIFSGQTTSWGSSEESWANPCLSAPERAAARHRCLGSGAGARTALLMWHLGLPAVNLQLLAGPHAKPSCAFCCQAGHATGRSNQLLILSRNMPAHPTVVPVCRGARRINGDTCCPWDMGYPATISIQPFSLPGAFCSALNRGLCPMVLISNFQPVSTDDNLISPSDFIFSCDFMSYSPQPLSSPLFCVWHSVWQLHPLSFCWISSHTAGSAWEVDRPGSTPRTPHGGWGLRDMSCHTGGFVCAPKGLAASTAQGGGGCRTGRGNSTEGKVSCPYSWEFIHVLSRTVFLGAGPKNFAGGAFLHSGMVCLPKRNRKDLWGRTENEEEPLIKTELLGVRITPAPQQF